MTELYLIVGKIVTGFAVTAVLICTFWALGKLAVYVTERCCIYAGVHKEVHYFICHRQELREIIAKQRNRRGR